MRVRPPRQARWGASLRARRWECWHRSSGARSDAPYLPGFSAGSWLTSPNFTDKILGWATRRRLVPTLTGRARLSPARRRVGREWFAARWDRRARTSPGVVHPTAWVVLTPMCAGHIRALPPDSTGLARDVDVAGPCASPPGNDGTLSSRLSKRPEGRAPEAVRGCAHLRRPGSESRREGTRFSGCAAEASVVNSAGRREIFFGGHTNPPRAGVQ